jgi:hypothetical protein
LPFGGRGKRNGVVDNDDDEDDDDDTKRVFVVEEHPSADENEIENTPPPPTETFTTDRNVHGRHPEDRKNCVWRVCVLSHSYVVESNLVCKHHH